MRKPNYSSKVITLLQELHKAYPHYNMGRHISTALYEYGDIWGMTDKEFCYALEKYKTALELDIEHSEGEINEIIRDGMELGTILNEEDEDGYN